jgi:inorganic triphosphatase YgiF
MSYVYGYDANTAALEMWHRNQEQLQASEEDIADDLATRMGKIADKLDLLVRHLDQRSSSMMESLDFVEQEVEKMEKSMTQLWGDENA